MLLCAMVTNMANGHPFDIPYRAVGAEGPSGLEPTSPFMDLVRWYQRNYGPAAYVEPMVADWERMTPGQRQEAGFDPHMNPYVQAALREGIGRGRAEVPFAPARQALPTGFFSLLRRPPPRPPGAGTLRGMGQDLTGIMAKPRMPPQPLPPPIPKAPPGRVALPRMGDRPIPVPASPSMTRPTVQNAPFGASRAVSPTRVGWLPGPATMVTGPPTKMRGAWTESDPLLTAMGLGVPAAAGAYLVATDEGLGDMSEEELRKWQAAQLKEGSWGPSAALRDPAQVPATPSRQEMGPTGRQDPVKIEVDPAYYKEEPAPQGPTPQGYAIKPGDFLSNIAAAHVANQKGKATRDDVHKQIGKWVEQLGLDPAKGGTDLQPGMRLPGVPANLAVTQGTRGGSYQSAYGRPKKVPKSKTKKESKTKPAVQGFAGYGKGAGMRSAPLGQFAKEEMEARLMQERQPPAAFERGMEARLKQLRQPPTAFERALENIAPAAARPTLPQARGVPPLNPLDSLKAPAPPPMSEAALLEAAQGGPLSMRHGSPKLKEEIGLIRRLNKARQYDRPLAAQIQRSTWVANEGYVPPLPVPQPEAEPGITPRQAIYSVKKQFGGKGLGRFGQGFSETLPFGFAAGRRSSNQKEEPVPPIREELPLVPPIAFNPVPRPIPEHIRAMLEAQQRRYQNGGAAGKLRGGYWA